MPLSIEHLISHAETQLSLNLPGEAANTYRQALAQEPNNPECLLSLSCTLMRLRQYEDAFHFVRRLLGIVTDIPYAYFLAGFLAREIGRWKDSRAYLLRAVEMAPDDMYARVLCCMASFTIAMDEQETLTILNTYASELDALIRSTRLDTAAEASNAANGITALTPFFLPYLGHDVTSLQRRYGSWVCDVMAARYPGYAQPFPQLPSTGRIRIGIVSNYFHNHSHWKIALQGWLEQLDRGRFSVHCFHTGDICDEITAHARTLSDSFLQSSDIEEVMSAISRQNLAVLIHSGIGMDTNSIRLAALRLAPVQCTSWGHPLTTGMRTIDYFLSSDLMEPEDGDEHYTEKLIRLPNLSIHCKPVEPVDAGSAALPIPGASHGDVIFLCCQNLLKYLPQHDQIFPDIALNVPNARFVFIESPVAELTQLFRTRIGRAFQSQGLSAADHVSFVPPLGPAEYAALNRRADIYLDSIEWSGGNTTLESLPFNKPIVTLPGRFMRGRHTHAILRRMGMRETIAGNVEEYVSIAVRLARDVQWREAVSEKISRNKHRIYGDLECVRAMERFLTQVSGSGGEADAAE